MKFKEARMIRSDEVKAMCIKDGFYTCGTNAEYCHLCGLSEIQAINILNGLYIREYMWINEREWVKNERKRIMSENT